MSCTPELEPPWARYPWIMRGSIGWRMGSGEGYLGEWGTFVAGIKTVEAAVEYLQRHPPAPRSWKSWIAGWIAEVTGAENDDGDEASPWDVLVEDEGLIAEDAAYPVFVRNVLARDGMVAPWELRNSPHDALRYSARELGWSARWLATECPDRVAYLEARPPAGPEWETVERSARTGIPAVPYATGGLEALVCTLAATGTLPPPWLAGLEPRGDIVWDDTADDRDHWLWWVTDTFEDAASWQRYLAQWPAAPDAWVNAFDEYYLALD